MNIKASIIGLLFVMVSAQGSFAQNSPAEQEIVDLSKAMANAVHRQFDVSPDGQRFLMIRRVGQGMQSQLILVQNFSEELRARAHH